MSMMPPAIFWKPHLGSLTSGLLMLVLIFVLALIYRRFSNRYTLRQSILLLAPKVLTFILLMLALFDPTWAFLKTQDGAKHKLAVVLDVSPSMDIADRNGEARVKRARRIIQQYRDRLSKDIEFVPFEFDSDLYQLKKPAALTESAGFTDLGNALVSLADTPGIDQYLGVLMLTDGGDEPIRASHLPPVPLFVTSVGNDLNEMNDIFFRDIDAPKEVELNTGFEIDVDLQASGNAKFEQSLSFVDVHIEYEAEPDNWTELASQEVDLRNAQARAAFKLPGFKTDGTKRLRVTIGEVRGELTTLNNKRELHIQIQPRALPVLLYTRSLGYDVNTLRKTLDKDSGLRLTALSRVTGENFFVQGDRQAKDEPIEKGFPSSAETLQLYKCVILGSFPANELTKKQQEALLEYINRGGAVVLLGGDQSFGRGGYADTLLKPIFPWQISGSDPDLLPGEFPVGLPPGSADLEMTYEFARALTAAGQMTLTGINRSGALKPGAIGILNTSVQGRTVSAVAIQPYGEGQVLAISGNTLWQWSRAGGAARNAYEVFWKQMIRYLGGRTEGERFLSIRWDRQFYRPGEEAEVHIAVAGQYTLGELRLEAQIKKDEVIHPVQVQEQGAKENSYRCTIPFAARGDYLVSISAFRGGKLLETYDKLLHVKPAMNEGADLSVNHGFLDQLASQTTGKYAKELEWNTQVDAIQDQVVQRSITEDVPLNQFKFIYISLFLVILIAEWIIRRKLNLF